MKKLPIPFDFEGRLLTAFAVHEPQTQAIGESRKKAKAGNVYEAMVELAKGSLTAFYDKEGAEVSGRDRIEKAVQLLPYRNIESVMIEAILESGVEDGIEGVYPCPLCGHKVIIEFDPEDDFADRISSLKVNVAESNAPIMVDLKKPVEIVDAEDDSVMERIESLTLRHPTVDDVLKAFRGVGNSDTMALQNRIYVMATTHVNGKEIDRKWRGEWGDFVYNRLISTDAREIGNQLQKYGRQTTVDRTCPECGKKWKAEVNTQSFFASGLSE